MDVFGTVHFRNQANIQNCRDLNKLGTKIQHKQHQCKVLYQFHHRPKFQSNHLVTLWCDQIQVIQNHAITQCNGLEKDIQAKLLTLTQKGSKICAAAMLNTLRHALMGNNASDIFSSDLNEEFCPICHHSLPRNDLKYKRMTKCCGQGIHYSCIETHKEHIQSMTTKTKEKCVSCLASQWRYTWYHQHP